MAALSAMKWTPQKTMKRAFPLAAAFRERAKESPRHVPQGDNFLPLVMVGENEELLPQGGFPGQDLLDQDRFIQGRNPFFAGAGCS